jgi:hypothetical protein
VDQAKLEKLVNDSGFPLQLRIEEEVRSSQGSWSVEFHEHPWRENAPAGKEHFLDLILKSGSVRLAVECKRTQNDASWVFLTDAAATVQRRARVYWVGRFSEGQGDGLGGISTCVLRVFNLSSVSSAARVRTSSHFLRE